MPATGRCPAWIKKASGDDYLPRRALALIATVGGLFVMLGSIERIAAFAGLTFILVFVAVNLVRAREAGKTSAETAAYAGTGEIFFAFVTVAVWSAQNRLSALLIAAGTAGVLALGG